jgi:hypothetical protein
MSTASILGYDSWQYRRVVVHAERAMRSGESRPQSICAVHYTRGPARTRTRTRPRACARICRVTGVHLLTSENIAGRTRMD